MRDAPGRCTRSSFRSAPTRCRSPGDRRRRRGHTCPVIPVPASAADLRLTLLDDRELEVDAGVSGPWSDSDWTSLPLPSANHCVGGVNLDGVEKLLFGNYLRVSRLD